MKCTIVKIISSICLLFIFKTGTLLCAESIVPVVFVHRGDSYYLNDSLWQAKQFNQRVVLLGDEFNKKYSSLGIEHYSIDRYSVGMKKFAQVYIHIHENKLERQIFNFQRWFILQEFMADQNINVCMYCDSDVMLYCDATNDFKNFSNYDISLVIPKNHSHCGSNSFWSKASLDHFCEYLMHYYESNDNITKWQQWFNSPDRKKGHGVGDMALLTEYAWHISTTRDINMADICTVVDNGTYDHQLSGDDGGSFDMMPINNGKKEHKIKNIQWIGGLPHCYHYDHNKLLKLKSLHFQGWKKRLMSAYRASFSALEV